MSLKPEDFKRIDANRFEALVSQLLEALGYRILEKPAIGPDGGRDLLVERTVKDFILEKTETVIVQCKHYAMSRKAVSETDVGVWQNAMARYKARGYLLVTDSRITENLSKAFSAYTSDEVNAPRWATSWNVDDLIRLLNNYPDLRDIFFGSRHSSLTSIAPLAAAQSRLRVFADSQIEQFARGKYIPKLYVDRRSQQQVLRFSANEQTIAESSRSNCLSSSKASIQRVTEHLSEFDQITNDLQKLISKLTLGIESAASDIENLTELISRLKNYGREKERKDAETSRLENLKTISDELTERRTSLIKEVEHRISIRRTEAAIVDELLKCLERCVEAASSLSPRAYFGQRGLYDTYCENLNNVLSLLVSEYGESEKAEDISEKTLNELTKKKEHKHHEQVLTHGEFVESLKSLLLEVEDEKTPGISAERLNELTNKKRKLPEGVLTDGGFVYSLKNLLKSEVENVSKLFRNTLVIIDRAGSGKTNMICHLVDSLATKGPVILLFGRDQFQDEDSIVQRITRALSNSLGLSSDPVEKFDRLLEDSGMFLMVFIDGINEKRNIPRFDAAISNALDWAEHHRIKFVLTCRDIYWDFFSPETWGNHVQTILTEELNQFSHAEYVSALPLYLEYYRINCELADAAMEACHHPLLLRFFCEAYGRVGGPVVNLGEVRDIRLKELFDFYVDRKARYIRRALRHGNSDRVLRYLFRLVSFMFKNLTTKVKASEVEEATGDSNTSTVNSLYIRLLDEDIIIEEQPGEDVDNRNVSFVYEEFMEYLLARSIINNPRTFNVSNSTEVFEMLDRKLPDWVNARGVAEYVALMFIQSENRRSEAINFFTLMIDRGETWCEAFWSVIGKCPEDKLDMDVFDLFSAAVKSTKLPNINQAVTAMARYSKAGSNSLSGILLWSVALPQALTWSELGQLERLGQNELERLGDRLVRRLKSREFSDPPGTLRFDSLLNTLLPFLGADQQRSIESQIQRLGGPERRHSSRAFIRVIWKSFPEYQPMLINGLFDSLDLTRAFCADKLQLASYARPQIGYLCRRLAEVERDPNIKPVLLHASKLLESEPHLG